MEKWMEKWGSDSGKRAERIRTCKRIGIFGLILMGFTFFAMLYVMLFDKPKDIYDAFLFALSFSVCFAASFAVTSEMGTEVKLLELLDEIKKENERI